jgi:hypothetical protein
VLSEEPPSQICSKQGSLWGIMPKTAKKTVKINLDPAEGGTKISCSSKLASDWKNITLIGCAFAFVLAGVCVWMATDLTTFLVTREPSFWSWLVTVGGNADLLAAQAFVKLTWSLTIFLSVIVLLEVAIVVYVRSKIDAFGEDVLTQLR